MAAKKAFGMPTMSKTTVETENTKTAYHEQLHSGALKEEQTKSRRACIMLRTDQFLDLKYLSIEQERTITSLMQEFVDIGLKKYKKIER